MAYQEAYEAYQKLDYDRCLTLLDDIKQNDIPKLDLMAQVLFFKKDFQKAYEIYTSLIGETDEYVKERQDNLTTLIVCAQLEQPGVLVTKPDVKIPCAKDIIEQVETINLKDDTVCDLSSKQDSLKRKKRKSKKRKQRLPKQYDAVAGPDPERWLPRRDRKGNAHKQKKRRTRPNNKRR